MKQNNLKKDVSSFYDYVWTEHLPVIEEHNRWIKTLIDEDEIRDKVILDAGCGTGVAAISFKALGAKEVMGIDLSQGALGTARKLARELKLDINFQQCDLHNLDLGEKSFDIIYSFGVLHHTGNTRLAFENLLRYLKPDGQFVLALYRKTSITFMHQGLRKILLTLPDYTRIPVSRLASIAMLGKKKEKRGFDGKGDALDWLYVPHRNHHTPEEISGWFSEHGMDMELLVPYTGRFKSTSNFIVKGFHAPSDAPVKKINVVHIIDHLGVGGAQNLLVDLAKYIEKYNITIIILKNENIHSEVLQQLGVPVRHVFDSKYNIGIKRLAAILQKEHADIVHTHLYKANIIGQLAAIKLHLPRVVHIHHIFDPEALLPFFSHSYTLIHMYLFFLRYILKDALRIIATNESSREYILNNWGIQPSRVVYIPNGISLDLFIDMKKHRKKYRKRSRESVNCGDKVPVIGMVGRFSKEKNWPLFFEVAWAMKKILPQAVFWAVGDGGELGYCKNLVKKLGLESTVHFWGFQKDLSQIYCGMDCFLFTSILDSFPLVLVETMLAELLVVTIDSPAPRDVIKHMRNGIILKDDNPETIAQTMVELLHDKELRARIIANGYQDCSKMFEVKRWVGSVMNLYDELDIRPLHPSHSKNQNTKQAVYPVNS